MTAHLVHALRHSVLAAEMDAARDAGTLVNAWRLDDGREVLGTVGCIAVADGEQVVRGPWPDGVSARDAVQALTLAEST